jgi:hypothetical protein
MKFRRGQRVSVNWYDRKTRLGTITNPKPSWGGYIRIRMDRQQPYETGESHLESNVEPYYGSEDEFQTRVYNLWPIPHAEIEALTDILKMSKHPLAATLLKRMPALP